MYRDFNSWNNYKNQKLSLYKYFVYKYFENRTIEKLSFSIMSNNIKKGQQPVDDQTRDKIFAQMRHQNQNNVCIDCEKKNPKWASVHLGIHLCIDCAGRHRQYGVVYSFIKSTNLDKWNQKQILYMQKGSNSRALQYFRKCGIISGNHRNIDYKSPVVQKYKAILTEQVQTQLHGEPLQVQQKKAEQKSTQSIKEQTQQMLVDEKRQIQIAEEVNKVQNQTGGKKKKEKKKKMGNQINIDFQSLTFDDGVSKEQKQKIQRSYETVDTKDVTQNSGKPIENNQNQNIAKPVQQMPKPKELSQEQVRIKMEQLKKQTNVKSISSDQFRDENLDNVQVKQKFNQFSGATSISSSAFNGDQEKAENQTMEKLKELVTATGGKFYEKISSYWGKN